VIVKYGDPNEAKNPFALAIGILLESQLLAVFQMLVNLSCEIE